MTLDFVDKYMNRKLEENEKFIVYICYELKVKRIIVEFKEE